MAKKNPYKRSDGSKAPSIYDVAHEARVSVFTVSAVMNKKGRVSPALSRRVEAAISKLNYRPEAEASETNTVIVTEATLRERTFQLILPPTQPVWERIPSP